MDTEKHNNMSTSTTASADKDKEPFLQTHSENEMEIQTVSPEGNGQLPLLDQQHSGQYNHLDSEKPSNGLASSNNVKSTDSRPISVKKKKPKIKLSEIFDFSVLKRVDSILLMIVCPFCFFGLMSVMIFLPGILREKGYVTYENASLLSMMGVGDLIGRIGSGFVADLKIIERFRLQATSALFAAIVACACIFIDNYVGLMFICAFYGMFSGGYVSQFAPVVLGIVGPERMSKNFAMGMFLQGLGSALGQPILGSVRDATGSYSAVLAICVATTLIGSCLQQCYPFVARLDKRLQEKKSSVA